MTILLSSNLYAKYEMFNDKNGTHYQMYSNIFLEDFDITNADRKELFFGKKSEYLESLNNGFNEIVLSSLNGATTVISSQAGNIVKGLTSTIGGDIVNGLAGGLIIGAIEHYRKELLKPVEYYYVVEFKNSKNEITRGIVYFESFSKKFKELKDATEIKEIMKKGF